MFLHQQRLLLFVAAALAVAMHMGTMMSVQAAAVPAGYQANTGGGSALAARKRGAIVEGGGGGGRADAVRRAIQGLSRRPLSERSMNRREARKLAKRKQKPLRADAQSASCAPSTSDSGSGDSNFPAAAPAGTTTTTKQATTTTTQTSTATATTTTTAAVTTTQTASATSSTIGTPYPVATLTTGAGTKLIVQSNSDDYGWSEAMNDLNAIMSWAGDDGNLTDAQKTELIAALFSASARYWPEVPTSVMIRIMLADIRSESDFRPQAIGGARLDSGSSWGLIQLSPGGGAQMMPLFQDHMNVATHNFTWGIDAPNVRAGVRGPLIDWETGVQMDLASLTNEDLFRPWVIIHAGMWIQSNLARMASADPWLWEAADDYSWALKQANVQTLSDSQQSTYTQMIAGAGLPRTPKTALGSWVAGAATNGAGSYTSSSDDVSANYFSSIMKSISFLYNGANGAQMQASWLDQWTVNAGLTDYL